MRRPAAVVIIAGFSWMAMLITIVVGTSLLFPGTPLDRIWELNRPAYAAFHLLGRAYGALLMLLAPLSAVVAWGLLHGRRWAWWLAVVTFAVNGAGDFISLAITGDVLRSLSGAVVASIFILCLLRRDVKAFFAQPG